MISWHRLMHSLQMYTPWPAMSLRTCSWLFPQKEQRYGTLGPLVLLFDDVTFARPGLLVLGLLRRLGRLGGLGRFFGCLRSLAAGHPGVVRLRDKRAALDRVDRVDDAIVLRILGRHEVVAVRVVDDLVQRLAGVPGEDLVVALDEVLPFLHLDDRVRGIAAEAAGSLVDHDPAVGQGVALAVRAGR